MVSSEATAQRWPQTCVPFISEDGGVGEGGEVLAHERPIPAPEGSSMRVPVSGPPGLIAAPGFWKGPAGLGPDSRPARGLQGWPRGGPLAQEQDFEVGLACTCEPRRGRSGGPLGGKERRLRPRPPPPPPRPVAPAFQASAGSRRPPRPRPALRAGTPAAVESDFAARAGRELKAARRAGLSQAGKERAEARDGGLVQQPLRWKHGSQWNRRG